MALSPAAPVVILDHSALPVRFVIQADGVYVYSEGKNELVLDAADALQLAAAVNDFYKTNPPA